jgi:hypothetical protein
MIASSRAVYGPGPSSNVKARHLLFTQSTGAGGLAVDDEGEGEDEGGEEENDDDEDEGEGDPPDDDADDEGEDGADGDGAGDRVVDVALIRCATRSVAEIGWQAVTNTPSINSREVTLVITSG